MAQLLHYCPQCGHKFNEVKENNVCPICGEETSLNNLAKPYEFMSYLEKIQALLGHPQGNPSLIFDERYANHIGIKSVSREGYITINDSFIKFTDTDNETIIHIWFYICEHETIKRVDCKR